MSTEAVATDTMTLLVVDDETAMRTLLQQTFEANGHKVLLAEGAEQALQVLKQEPVDLVLTDLRMEGMSGIDLLKEIIESKVDTGLILISGFATLETAMEAMRLGAIDVIQKPLNMAELNKKIDEFMKKRRSEKGGASSAPAPTPPKEENPMNQPAAGENVEVQRVDLPQMHPAQTQQPSDSIDKILDIPVQATVRLGRTSLQIADLLKLGVGSVIELDRHAGEPVELLVNNKLVAMGEVVVVHDTFGLRVTSIIDHQQRIQSLAK